MAKWVTGWNGLLEESTRLYPDAKYVVIARDPREQMPSWMKLQGLLAEPISGINTIRDFPAIREAVLQINTQWYQKQRSFCDRLVRVNMKRSAWPSDSMMLVSFDDFVQDIPAQIGKVYAFLDQPVRPAYESFLQQQRKRQTQHKRTIISETEAVVSEETLKQFVDMSLWSQIKRTEDFPHLVHPPQ